jgi:hypothetical protein
MPKPVFQSVIDFGLRDVGVKSEPRRLALYLGKSSLGAFVLLVAAVIVACILLRATDAGRWAIVVSALALTVGLVAFAVVTANRAPMSVVKVRAEGTNQAAWLLILPFALLGGSALVLGNLLLLPIVLFSVVMTVLAWRGRGHLPDVLRRLRALLTEDESVAGDGCGAAKGARNARERFRLIVATDRRLLVTASTRSKGPFVLVDVPHRRVTRFGIAWKLRGRLGELSLTIAGETGEPDETHVITSIAPANLVSIAEALQSQGISPDDPALVEKAGALWAEAREAAKRRRERLFDRRAMTTREFDLGLWLLVPLCMVVFWLDPLGIGGSDDPLLLLVASAMAVCLICGYVSGTKASLAYLVPLNLLVVPTFFYVEPGGVILFMITLSMVGAVGLLAGAALRSLCRRRAGGPEGPAPRPGRPAARGTLRGALSGIGLIRLTGMLLVGIVLLAMGASAFGFDARMVRLAVEEVTREQKPVDGRSNLTGNAASLRYTPGPDLKELITDEDWGEGPNDGARWELRSKFTKGYNVVSLAHYIFVDPRLDEAAAVADFVADKDREHERAAGDPVPHRERVVDGRKGYTWNHRARDGFWQYAAWFPHPVHSVRVECIAKSQEDRFRRLCAEAVSSLEFHE